MTSEEKIFSETERGSVVYKSYHKFAERKIKVDLSTLMVTELLKIQ